MFGQMLTSLPKAIAQYQSFWDVLDDFDRNTIILDPTNPTRAENTRRVYIGAISFLLPTDQTNRSPLPSPSLLYLQPSLFPFKLRYPQLSHTAAWKVAISMVLPKQRPSSSNWPTTIMAGAKLFLRVAAVLSPSHQSFL